MEIWPLIILNIPLVGLFVSLVRVPQGVLAPFIVIFCVIGAYSLNNSVTGIWVMIAFGVIGYFLRKTGFDPAPLLLAFVLGSLLKQNLCQGLIIGLGDPAVFLSSPIIATFLAMSAFVLIGPFLLALLRRTFSGSP